MSLTWPKKRTSPKPYTFRLYLNVTWPKKHQPHAIHLWPTGDLCPKRCSGPQPSTSGFKLTLLKLALPEMSSSPQPSTSGPNVNLAWPERNSSPLPSTSSKQVINSDSPEGPEPSASPWLFTLDLPFFCDWPESSDLIWELHLLLATIWTVLCLVRVEP